jgi:hypothetical protein
VKIPGTRARAALREARQSYRRHSGAEPAVAVIEATAERQDRQLPSIAERGRDAVRRLRERRRFPARRDDPDVVLDIPRVHVDEIELKLDELHARVALEAHVLDLLRLDVGVEADVRGVDLKIAGVEAEARLKVRLENLTMILDRVMDTIDANPQIISGLADRLGEVGARAAGEIARGVRRAA